VTRQPDIDAAELISVCVSPDGHGLRLRVRDRTGRASLVALPMSWLNTILNVLPRRPSDTEVYPLDSWNMDRAPNGRDLVLTLRTPEGQAISFTIKSWQIVGMATIAAYGGDAGPTRTVH
jgi:hypothetical protein